MSSRGPSAAVSFSSLSYSIFPVVLKSDRRFTVVYGCVRPVHALSHELGIVVLTTGKVLRGVIVGCIVPVDNQLRTGVTVV